MSSPTPVLAPSVGPPRRNAGAWLALGIVIVGLAAAAVAAILLFGPRGVAPPVAPARGTLRTMVEPGGGTIDLAGGARLVVPPGAVERPTELAVALRATNGAVVVDAPEARFARPVELEIPLPPEVTADQAAGAISGTFERGVLTIEHAVRVETRGGHRALVVPIDHFSLRLVIIVGGAAIIKGGAVAFDWLKGWIWAPPAQVPPIPISIYHQGPSPECLSAAITMLDRSLVPGSEEVWRFMHGAGFTTRGEGAAFLRFGEGAHDEIKRVTGVEPEILLWNPIVTLDTGPLLGSMKRYIQLQLAAGHPVVFASTAMAMGGGHDVVHAIAIVGYDGAGYWAANPQDLTLDDCTIRRYTEAELGITWALRQSYVTVVVPKALAPARPLVTVSFPPHAAWFRSPAGDRGPIYKLEWDGAKPAGIRWGTPTHQLDPISDEVTQLVIGGGDAADPGGVEVINNSGAPQTVVVQLTVTNVDTGKLVALAGTDTELRAMGMIPAKAKRRFPFVIDLMQLRRPGEPASHRFQITATVTAPGARDTATLDITLAPDLGKVLVGVWEGTAAGAGAITLSIATQTGKNFTGTFAMQGTTLGIAGTWDAATQSWSLEVWEPRAPTARYPAPGSLLPYSDGRLQLTAPGGLLTRRSSSVPAAAVDDPYHTLDPYLPQ